MSRQPDTYVAVLDVANVRGDQWCPDCKASTGFLADLVALYEGGVAVVGTVAGCVICSDPDDPEAHRG